MSWSSLRSQPRRRREKPRRRRRRHKPLRAYFAARRIQTHAGAAAVAASTAMAMGFAVVSAGLQKRPHGSTQARALEEQLQGLRHGPLRPRVQEEPVQGLRHGHRQARALISVIKCRLFFYSESITAGCLRRTAPTRPDDPNRQASSSLAQRTPARSTGGDRPSGTDMNRVMPLAAARTTGCYRKSVPGSH